MDYCYSKALLTDMADDLFFLCIGKTIAFFTLLLSELVFFLFSPENGSNMT